MLSIHSVLILSLVSTLAYGLGALGNYKGATLPSDDPAVQFMVDGINSMYALQGDNSVRTLKRVVNVKAQVVAGMKYLINAEVLNNDKTEKCTAEIWSQLWTPVPYQFISGPTCTAK